MPELKGWLKCWTAANPTIVAAPGAKRTTKNPTKAREYNFTRNGSPLRLKDLPHKIFCELLKQRGQVRRHEILLLLSLLISKDRDFRNCHHSNETKAELIARQSRNTKYKKKSSYSLQITLTTEKPLQGVVENNRELHSQ